MPTTPDGRWSPNDGDDWDLTTDLAAMQVSNSTATSTAISTAIAGIPPAPQNYRIGTDAQRLALSGANLFEGLEFRTTDTKRNWLYTNSTWVSNDPGIYLLRPTSVTGTGVVINPDGTVTATNSSLIALNGVFSTRFKYYEIRWSVDKAVPASAVLFRMRNAGTDDSSSSYILRKAGTNGSGFIETTTGLTTFFEFSMANRNTQIACVRIHNPATPSLHTRMISGTSFDTDGASFTQTMSVVGEHRVASAFDGFSLNLSGSNLSGDVRVYGLI